MSQLILDRRCGSHTWFDPTGGAILCVEATSPGRWRMRASEVLPTARGADCETRIPCGPDRVLDLSASLPPGHTILAAGVVSPHHLSGVAGPESNADKRTGLTPPRSVLISASQGAETAATAMATAATRDAPTSRLRRGPRAGDHQGDRCWATPQASIHIWTVELHRSLLPAARAVPMGFGDGSESGTTAPAPGAAAAGAKGRPWSALASCANPASEGALHASGLTLQEVGRMLVPDVVLGSLYGGTPVGPAAPSAAAATAAPQSAAAAPSDLRCCLAAEGRGAWAALQASPSRVLLLGFAAALTAAPSPTAPAPAQQLTEPDLTGSATGAAWLGGAGSGPAQAPAGGSEARGRWEPVQVAAAAPPPLRCLDLDLAAAAPVGGRVLSCCVYDSERVVLDILIGADADGDSASSGAGRFAARPNTNVGPAGTRRPDSVLRLSLDVVSSEATPGDRRRSLSGVEDASTSSAAASGKEHTRHWTASQPLQLPGRVTACCPLPSLPPWPAAARRSYCLASGPSTTFGDGRRGKGSGCGASPTGSVEAGEGTAAGGAAGAATAAAALAAATAPAALVGCDRGGLQLLTPEGFAAAAAAADAEYDSSGCTAAVSVGPFPAPSSLLSGAAQPSTALPGPVLSMCPLPQLQLTRLNPSASSAAGHDAPGEEWRRTAASCYTADPNQPAGARRAGNVTGSSADAATAVGVLCGDARRSLVVVAVRQRRQLSPPPLLAKLSAELRPGNAPTTAGAAAGAAALSDPAWSLQRLMAVGAVQLLLPVPLPSPLTLAVATAAVGSRTVNSGDGGADDGAVLVSVGAVAVLVHNGASAAAACQGTTGHDVDMEDGDDGEPEDFKTGYDSRSGSRGGARAAIDGAEGEWGQRAGDDGDGDGDGGGGGRGAGDNHSRGARCCAPVGPLSLGPWDRAVLLPAKVRPLPPQVLLSSGDGDPMPAPGPAGAAAAGTCTSRPGGGLPFAAGCVSRVLQVTQDPQGGVAGGNDQHRDRHGLHHDQQRRDGGGDDDGEAAKGMAKVLAHMARRWDAAVHRATEQRAALGRMNILTQQAEGLIAAAGQGPLPTRGSGAARPPFRLGRLDPLLDLESEVLRTAMCDAPGPGPAAAAAGEAGGTAAPAQAAAVDRWLDELLGPDTAAGTGAGGGDAAAAVTIAPQSAVGSLWCKKEEAPTAPTTARRAAQSSGADGGAGDSGGGTAVGAAAAASAAAAAVQQGGGHADLVSEDAPSYLAVHVESLGHALRGGEWVLQAVLRVYDNQYGDAGTDGAAAVGLAASRSSSPGLRPAVQLDDVVLLPYCRTDDGGSGSGGNGGGGGALPLPSCRGRWAVLHGGKGRVFAEAAVPVGDLWAFAARGDASGPCLAAPSPPRPRKAPALGPLPSLLQSDDESGSEDPDATAPSSSEPDDCGEASGSLSSNRTAAAGRAASTTTAAASTVVYGLPYRSLQLGAMVRVTARLAATTCPSSSSMSYGAAGGGGGSGPATGLGGHRQSTITTGAGGGGGDGRALGSYGPALVCRTLDAGTVHFDLEVLLATPAPRRPPSPTRPPVTAPFGTGNCNGGGGGSGGGGGRSSGAVCGQAPGPVQAPAPPAVGSLLAGTTGTRSMLLVAAEASTSTSAPAEVEAGGGVDPAGGIARLRAGPAAGCSLRGRSWVAWGAEEAEGPEEPGRGPVGGPVPGCCGLRSALAGRLRQLSGFGQLHADSRQSEGAAAAARQFRLYDTRDADCLVWEGPLGWRCGASLLSYGKYGCEIELSYIGHDAGGAGGWCQAACLDQVQRLVTEAAAGWCEQAGRRLSVHCPSPLSGPALERLDTAAGCLQRCVEATLGLLEGSLLAQQHQQPRGPGGQRQQRRQQQQQGQRLATHHQHQQEGDQRVGVQGQMQGQEHGQLHQAQSRRGDGELGLAAEGCREGPPPGGGEAANRAAAGGPGSAAELQAQLQEVLQLQLQLSCAMEGLLLAM